MSKQRKTEPRWINTRVVRDLRTGEVLEREGYWYEGAVALATDPPTREASSWQFCTPCGEVVATINSNLIGTKNTNLNLDADTTYYFRAGVEETAGNTWKNATIRLLANPVAAGFQQVTTTSTYVRAVADGNTTDGNDSVQSNVTSGEFTLDSTNEGIGHDGLAGGNTADLASTGFECVFSIQFRSADFSDGQTVVLKLVDSNASDGDLDNYQQTDVTVTVNIPSNPTTVTLNNDSLTLSDGTLGINQSQPPITMVADSFTLTDGTLTVRAEQETRVALTPDSLTLSDGTLTVRAEQETRITLGTDALTLSDGSLTVQQAAPTVVTLTPDSLTLSDGTLTVRAEQETRVALIPDSFTLSDGTLSVRAETENRIALVPDSLTLTDGTLVVTQSAATPAVETRKKKGGGKLPPLQAPKYNLHMVDGIPPSPKEEQKEKIAELPKKVREIKKEIKRLESIDLSADMVEMDRLVTQEIVLRLKLIEFEERLEQQKKDEERTRLEAAKEADRKLKAERERLREEKRQAELKRLEEQRKAAEKRLKEKLERIRQARLEAERRERAILHREIRESAEQSQELIDRINEQIQQIEDDRERKKREKDLMFVVMAMLQ